MLSNRKAPTSSVAVRSTTSAFAPSRETSALTIAAPDGSNRVPLMEWEAVRSAADPELVAWSGPWAKTWEGCAKRSSAASSRQRRRPFDTKSLNGDLAARIDIEGAIHGPYCRSDRATFGRSYGSMERRRPNAAKWPGNHRRPLGEQHLHSGRIFAVHRARVGPEVYDSRMGAFRAAAYRYVPEWNDHLCAGLDLDRTI